jgi:hypothetical protein
LWRSHKEKLCGDSSLARPGEATVATKFIFPYSPLSKHHHQLLIQEMQPAFTAVSNDLLI